MSNFDCLVSDLKPKQEPEKVPEEKPPVSYDIKRETPEDDSYLRRIETIEKRVDQMNNTQIDEKPESKSKLSDLLSDNNFILLLMSTALVYLFTHSTTFKNMVGNSINGFLKDGTEVSFIGKIFLIGLLLTPTFILKIF